MTTKQVQKAERNNAIREAFRKELKENPRRSDNEIIGTIMPQFPEISSPITFRTIIGKAGLLKTI